MYNQIVNNNFLKGRKIMSSINLAFGFPKEAEKAKAERWPVLIPVGTMEYHSEHCAYGCDSLVSIGTVDRIAQKIDAVVLPPIWYGVASFAVAGPEKNTIHVDCDTFEDYMYAILKSLIYGGWRNIYMIISHQTEDYNPMQLACMKAARKLIFEYLEDVRGKGWWGSNEMKEFYDSLDNDDNPWNWIKAVGSVPDSSGRLSVGDHAGKHECSVLKALFPEAVKEERIPDSKEWFTQTAKDMSAEYGEEEVQKRVDKLIKYITNN